jgi:hypothetical protein
VVQFACVLKPLLHSGSILASFSACMTASSHDAIAATAQLAGVMRDSMIECRICLSYELPTGMR